jgi:ABC-type transporter Mla subunit MlaD
MDNDELERLMNFIVQRQEQGAEQLAQADAIINALAKSQLHATEQLENHDERIARFERSYAVIGDLLKRHDDQLIALTDGLNSLTRTVERYITAQGNGNGGA